MLLFLPALLLLLFPPLEKGGRGDSLLLLFLQLSPDSAIAQSKSESPPAPLFQRGEQQRQRRLEFE
ncbi:hypothetical protein ASD86_21740 [Lysobacter sp. Root690]|nr:hypothetical protein ASD86_21740 [Lysobacter sp. Root690]